jgi:hypothetical protein
MGAIRLFAEVVLRTCDDAPYVSEYGPLDNRKNREIRMLQNVEWQMAKQNVGVFLVGLAHLHSMSTKFGPPDILYRCER